MIGKLIAWGESRESALARMRVALNEIVIEGIKSNVALQKDIVTDCAFMEGGTDYPLFGEEAGAVGVAYKNTNWPRNPRKNTEK